MKKRFFSVLPALFMLVCLLSALGGTAWAAEYEIAVGVTYAVGDTVVMPGETWILEDDSPASSKDCDAGSYPVLEVTKNNPTYSQGKIQLQGEAFFGTYPIDIYVTKPADKKADDPVGFRIKSGNGTEKSPYAFEFVYDQSASSFTVYFDPNGAAGGKNPVTDVSGSYILPANPFTWRGYEFIGWKVNNTGDLLQPGDTINVTANVMLYAQWQLSEYTLKVSDGTATFNGVTSSYLTGLHYQDVVTVTAAEPPEGQVFDLWNADSGGSFGNRYEATTTFTMPAGNGSIWVRYKDAVETCVHYVGDDKVTLYAWEGSAPMPDTAGAWFLSEDVTLTETWEVPEGVTYLCLHHHNLTLDGDGPVISVGSGATLYLYADNQILDCKDWVSHAEECSGCGISVDGGSFTLEIACIGGNDGGGVVVNDGSAHITNRCRISDNGSEEALGGGIRVNGGSCEMDNGIILNNRAAVGGGVYVGGGSFSMELGSIYSNTAWEGSGVFVADGSFRVGYYAAPGSVYLASGQLIGFTGTKLDESVCIPVKMENGAGVFTSGLSRKGSASNFVSEDDNYVVAPTGAGEAQLIRLAIYILPASTSRIEESAFEGNETVSMLYVPDSCTEIGRNAFKNCTGMVQIRLPEDCAIDDSALDGCASLQAILAPAGGTVQAWARAHGIPFTAE